jgi:hypothetical protein
MSLRSFVSSLFLAFVVLSSPAARALSELGARIREAQVLKAGPSEDAGESPVRVEAGDRLLVLGSSVDSLYVQVLKKGSGTGWIEVNRVDLFRLDRSEYDAFYYEMMRESAVSSRWNLCFGPNWGTVPFGLGGEAMVSLNIFRRGVFESNGDQLEISTGFKSHLGADPDPLLRADGTLSSKPAQPFWQIPLQLVWLARFGHRGETMLGPRLGFAYVRDSYSRFGSALPAVAGIEFRHFTSDVFGVSWSAQAYLRSVVYYSTSFGLNFRY